MMKWNEICECINRASGFSRFLTLLVVCFIASGITYAQDFKITKFEKNPLGLKAALANVKDNNGDVCAMIKFYTRDYKNFSFEANLGIVDTDTMTVGETLIYVPKGTKRITVRHPKLGILRHYTIPVRIEAKTGYEAEIQPLQRMEFANNRIGFLKIFIFHKSCGLKLFGGEDTSSYLFQKHKKRIEDGYKGVPIIDACFDSDRLDLTRVGIIPDPYKMATKEGAEKARKNLLSQDV